MTSTPSDSRSSVTKSRERRLVERQGADRGVAGVNRTDRGIGGFIFAANTGPQFWLGWAAYAIVVVSVQLLDVGDALHSASALKLATPVWRAVTDGYSSALVVILVYPAVRALARTAPPSGRGVFRFAATHLAGAVAFTITHVCGFTLIRAMVYGLHGQAYPTGLPGAILYEAPRDAIIYALSAGANWALMAIECQIAVAKHRPAAIPVFDIRDGARVIRVAVDQILAVRSADNYSEFLLRDGRAILMRVTLSALQAQLEPYGLARSHRSWLVNLAEVKEIAPVGSGDYVLSLPGGIQAPLSRSYRPIVSARLAPISRGAMVFAK